MAEVRVEDIMSQKKASETMEYQEDWAVGGDLYNNTTGEMWTTGPEPSSCREPTLSDLDEMLRAQMAQVDAYEVESQLNHEYLQKQHHYTALQHQFSLCRWRYKSAPLQYLTPSQHTWMNMMRVRNWKLASLGHPFKSSSI